MTKTYSTLSKLQIRCCALERHRVVHGLGGICGCDVECVPRLTLFKKGLRKEMGTLVTLALSFSKVYVFLCADLWHGVRTPYLLFSVVFIVRVLTISVVGTSTGIC